MDRIFARPFSLIALSGVLLCAGCDDPQENAEVDPVEPGENQNVDLAELSLEEKSALSANPLRAGVEDDNAGDSRAVTAQREPRNTNPATTSAQGAAAPPGDPQANEGGLASQQDLEQAVAMLSPVDGSNVRGTVIFTRQSNGILVEAELTGLGPGEHGFHVHEFGDCGGEKASAAGDHMAPHAREHGDPEGDPGERHVGDLGNLSATSQGSGHYSRVDPVIAFSGENNILGKAVIVHGMEDDLTSQPSGNSGDPVACGVIESANELTQDGERGQSPENA